MYRLVLHDNHQSGFINPFKTILFAILVFYQAGLGVEVNVGGTTIILPAPKGFTNVTDPYSDTYGWFLDITPETNTLQAVFIPHKNAASLLKGEEVELQRYMMIQTFKNLETSAFTLNDFSEYRKSIREAQEKAKILSHDRMEELLEESNKRLNKRYESHISLSIGEPISLGVVREDVNSITASYLTKVNTSIDDQNTERVMAGTMVNLLVKGKLFYLYIFSRYEEEGDLTWTQEAAHRWTNQVISSNSSSNPLSPSKIISQNTNIPTEVKELLAGTKSTYSIKGHEKAHGIDLSIKYPASWKKDEGVRPHIVQKFTGNSVNSVTPGVMILVMDEMGWETAFFETDDWEELLDEIRMDMVPEGAKYLGGGKTKIDAEPAIWMKYYVEQERSGLKMGMFTLSYAFTFKNRIVLIQGTVIGMLGDYLVLEDSFNSYLPMFQWIENSIVINDKWDSPGSTSLPNSEYWLFALAVSLFITWGIGLLPPVITRFLILRRCISKIAARVFSVSFLVLNIIGFTIMGSESKTHAALFLVAFASYAILRYGSADDDREKERLKAEKEKVQWQEQAKRAKEDARRAEEEKQFKRKHARDRAEAENERKAWEEAAKKAREDARRAKEEAERAKEEAYRKRTGDQNGEGYYSGPRDGRFYANVLGLQGNVSKDQIRKRYRELAAKYHPDRVASLGPKLRIVAEQEMKEINEAYEFLKQRYGL